MIVNNPGVLKEARVQQPSFGNFDLSSYQADRISELIVSWTREAQSKSCWSDFRHGRFYRTCEILE